MTAGQLDLLDLLAELDEHPPRRAPDRSAPTPKPLQLTDDEKLVIWWLYDRLCLPSMATNTDWTIASLRASDSSGGDYRIHRDRDKTRTTITLYDRTPIYTGGPCPDYCHPCGPDFGGRLWLCAPEARGHGTGFTDTGRTHTAELIWTRLAKWMRSLTDVDRFQITACGRNWATLQDLYWVLLRLLGPKPTLDDIFPSETP